MSSVKMIAIDKISCGGCGKIVNGEYKAQDPAPCGCVWVWDMGSLSAHPSRCSWLIDEYTCPTCDIHFRAADTRFITCPDGHVTEFV